MSLVSNIKFPLPDGGFYDTSLNVSANVGTEELKQIFLGQRTKRSTCLCFPQAMVMPLGISLLSNSNICLRGNMLFIGLQLENWTFIRHRMAKMHITVGTR